MKRAKNHIITAMGIILLITGLYLVKTTDCPGPFMTALPYVCLGIGCGAFAYLTVQVYVVYYRFKYEKEM